MGEFVLTGSDVFGMYCRIEQKRFGVPNEMYLYKVVSSLRSNCWCEVPYREASNEVIHNSMEDCVLAIRCGIDETDVQRFRMEDVEFLHQEIEPEERTCHMIRDDLTDTVYCDVCGERFDSVAQYMAMVPNLYSVTDYELKYKNAKFCPHCGAKVVKE